MRLDKFLSVTGTCSRREAKDFFRKRKIYVNGLIPKSIDINVEEESDEILFCGQKVIYEKNIYIMMNKPQGYVCANSDKKEKTVFELMDDKYKNIDLFVAGRLDKDTEGLLLITNDGAFAHNMLSPKKHVPKTYYAKIQGEIKQEHKVLFQKGVEIDDGYKCMPSKLEILKSGDESEILLTIHEGKFHQVKRMFLAIDTKVIFLKRVKIGSLNLDENLEQGEYKKLSDEEVLLIGVK